MRTLAELGDFLGLPTGSLEIARFGGPRQTTLGGAGLLVTSIPEADRRSLAALIDATSRLAEVTLTADLDGPRSGAEPFVTRLRVSPAVGATWWTTLFYELDGKVTGSQEVPTGGGAVTTSSLSAGVWTLAVERAGVGPGGPARRRVAIPVSATRPDQRKPPDKPPPDDPPPATPTCAVQFKEFQGDSTEVVTVSGSNFAGTEELVIVVDGVASTTTRTDGGGHYRLELSLLRASPKQKHTFSARSRASGKTSNTFEYQA